jgi:hypothetical protein
VGDFVDLENDQYADPLGINTMFADRLVEVLEVNRETSECVAIGVDGFDMLGFPVDHEIQVQPRNEADFEDETALPGFGAP